jgi:hypothetical protein
VRKLEPPAVDDNELLANLKVSTSRHARLIKDHIPAIGARYELYANKKGDPWQVEPDPSFRDVRENLLKLYSHPPVALDYLSKLRASAQGACAMCGRDGLGTLDHYLPKADYAEYSFFSRNVVPACARCNNYRGTLTRGENTNQRAVHPYFDEFLRERVMTAEFVPDWRAPRINPVPFQVTGDVAQIVQWHIDKIIRPAGIEDYYVFLWGQLISEPFKYIYHCRNVEDLRREISWLSKYEEVTGMSPNSWKSCFFHGLSNNADALTYLFTLWTDDVSIDTQALKKWKHEPLMYTETDGDSIPLRSGV